MQTVKGTKDSLPEDQRTARRIVNALRTVAESANFAPIETPILEPAELFDRAVGTASDVRKEMYRFRDKGDRELALRPEGTAPVARAYVQHKLHALPAPQKLWYAGPMFRYEQPQAGRQRQFTQAGVEVFGSADPRIDAEAITLAEALIVELSVPGVELVINSIGCKTCRQAYVDRLEVQLQEVYARHLCDDCAHRATANPLRVLDCKMAGCQEVAQALPSLAEALCEPCAAHFKLVCDYLDDEYVTYEIDPRLVRGLDYYERTVFEYRLKPKKGEAARAQNALLAGGRYDGLVKELGGPDVPGVGWAAGVERLASALGEAARGSLRQPELFVIVPGPSRELDRKAFKLAWSLRAAGIRCEVAPPGERGSQLKHAARLGAGYAVLYGADEVASGAATLRDLTSGKQVAITTPRLADWLKSFAAAEPLEYA